MRNGTVVEGLNANCAGAVNNHRCVTVELLTGEIISIPIEGKTTCSAIWNRVEGELVARGVVHPQIFGLAIKTGSDWVFVDPDAKLSKYFPKEGKSTLTSSASTSTSQAHHSTHNNDGKLPVVFHCRVHFYLDALPQNFDVVSLHHYYLQLRQNLTFAPRFPPASIVQSLAYALQSEFGDWRPSSSSNSSSSSSSGKPQELLPPRWIQSLPPASQSLISSLGPSITRAHQALAGLGQQNARLAFIRAVMPQYNMHLFGMTLKTKEGKDAPAWIGVTPKGIEVYQNAVGCNEIPEQPRLTFLWANITKLYFERKKFEIRGRAFPWANSTQKLSFTASSESVPRHVLLLCRSTHQFHLSNHKILQNGTASSDAGYSSTSASSTSNGSAVSSATSKTSGASTASGGESSCNSTLLSSVSNHRNEDTKMLDLSLWADGLLLAGETGEGHHQRVSVISNASSNTTSGIVSDRVYSLDGSEEDLEIRDCCGSERAQGHHHSHHHSHSHHHHHMHNGTSRTSLETSLESLSHQRQVHHHPGNSGGAKCTEDEAKYWYCDSDCEDCDDDSHHTRPCRSSLLVRTIGGEEGSSCSGPCPSRTATCECNSCLAEDDEEDEEVGVVDASEDSVDGHNNHKHTKNTPSMASETTLKAVDSSESSSMKEEVEEYKLDDVGDDDHVYGEISEDLPPPKSKDKTEEEEYSTISEEGRSGGSVVAPKPKPRKMYSCIKSVEPQKHGCKCRSRDKCCNKGNSSGKPVGGVVCAKKQDKLVVSTSSRKCGVSSDGSQGSANGLTPKVASLKCLRKVHRNARSELQQDNNNSGVKRVTSSREVSSTTKEKIYPRPPMNYVEFGEKLQQGRYPSTRTVSDNFDTDSDYVQLPPLSWYPPPPKPPPKNGTKKMWKFSGGKSNGGQSSESPTPPEVNMSTLPRRKTSCDEAAAKAMIVRQRIHKVSSRSTNAINLLGQSEKRPEPPPKPRKSLADLTASQGEDGIIRDGNGNAVDARFIATKPQILIQTAYATTAPVAIPSQAQVLLRGVKLAENFGLLQHSQSVDNIYDTVASEDVPNTVYVPSMSPPPYPSKNSQHQQPPLIIRPGNYIDVHASGKSKKNQPLPALPQTTSTTPSSVQQQASAYIAAALGGGVKSGVGNRCGSMPNNLNNFLIGLQNLKPLSRAPIVHPGPGATTNSCLTLNQSNNNSVPPMTTASMAISGPMSTNASTPAQSRFTTVYTNQLTRSQIQQFKAQLYSDLDYVIFPQKDPRVSQQEYFDSKSLSYTTVSSTTNSNPMLTSSVSAYQINDIPPPYLPPPPPYPSTAAGAAVVAAAASVVPPPLPRKNPKPKSGAQTTVTASLSNHSITATAASQPYHHTSFQSLYNPGGSNCSSSQYGGGYYCASTNGATASSGVGLNAENLQRFLSTQSYACSTSNCSNGAGSSSMCGGGAIYYPSSTQSAPPLPPYKKHGQGQQQQVIIENGMRKAIQQQLASLASRSGGVSALSEEKLRMKLYRSEESLYSQPTKEEHLQAIYNLPPPPPYKGTVRSNSHLSRPQESMSAAELDLANLRAKCQYLELPLLRALCSEGELLSKTTSTKALLQAAKNKIRPTAHAHPIPPPKLSLPPKKSMLNPPLPPKLSTPKNQSTTTT